MNNKRRLTLMFAAMSGVMTASDTSSVGYMQQASDVCTRAYQACNVENVQNVSNIVLTKAVEAKKAIAAQAESLGSVCVTAYEACNKENAQNAFRYVQGQAKEHPWITGAIVVTPILAHLGYKLYSNSELLTEVEKDVVAIVKNSSGKTARNIRLTVAEELDFYNQTVEKQQEILNALDKFVK